MLSEPATPPIRRGANSTQILSKFVPMGGSSTPISILDAKIVRGDSHQSMYHFIAPPCGAYDLRLAVSVPLPIVMGIFVLLWFQSRLT